MKKTIGMAASELFRDRTRLDRKSFSKIFCLRRSCFPKTMRLTPQHGKEYVIVSSGANASQQNSGNFGRRTPVSIVFIGDRRRVKVRCHFSA